MNPSDILPTIAEISVAIVGFAGILFALGKRGEHNTTKMNLFRIRIMAETGMLATFLSLTPIFFLSIPMLVPYTWRLSCFILVVLMPAYSVLSFNRQFRLIGKYVESKLDYTVIITQVPIISLQVMVVIQWGNIPQFGSYLFGLLFWLGISMLMFVRIILDSAEVAQSGT